VIDNPTTFPAWVRNAAKYLEGNTGQYIFVSTISVYSDDSQPNKDESDKTTPMPAGVDPYTTDPANYKYYGALKTFSEQEVERQYPGINTIVRPGLIVGPLDPSDRFTYWPARIARGGTVLAPGKQSDPIQFIDARDLAEFTVRLAENHTRGVFNATGPSKPLTVAEMLYGIKAVTSAGAQFVWVPEEFLSAQKVQGWSDMPVWVGDAPDTRGFARRDIARALAAGLTFRPLAVTAKDTLDWVATLPAAQQQRIADAKRAGMNAAREAAVLAAWAAKSSGKAGGSR
jgi:2'-hydroxyisoflavone reductase